MPYQPDYAESPAQFEGKDAACLGWRLVKSIHSNAIAKIWLNLAVNNTSTLFAGSESARDTIVTSFKHLSPALLPVSARTPEQVASSIQRTRELAALRKPRAYQAPRKIYAPPALKPWKRLTIADRLKRYLGVLHRNGKCCEATLCVDRDLQTTALAHPRGPTDYFYRRIVYHLKKMKREVDFVVVGEFSRAGLFHLHGVFDLAPDEFEDAKAAFRLACGKWTVESRNKQFKLRPMPDQGWLGYMIKDTSGLEKNLPSVTRKLGHRAMVEHLSMDRKHINFLNRISRNDANQLTTILN